MNRLDKLQDYLDEQDEEEPSLSVVAEMEDCCPSPFWRDEMPDCFPVLDIEDCKQSKREVVEPPRMVLPPSEFRDLSMQITLLQLTGFRTRSSEEKAADLEYWQWRTRPNPSKLFADVAPRLPKGSWGEFDWLEPLLRAGYLGGGYERK